MRNAVSNTNINNRDMRHRKISICHLYYLAIICLLGWIAVIVILPGRINDDAFHNFSFAATITSIVLAVVSIVYSIQSGLSSIGQLNSLKDIEDRIKLELSKFAGIENRISEKIAPINQQMGDVKNSQNDIMSVLGELSKITMTMKPAEGQPDAVELEGNAYLFLTLYAAAKSKETDMDFPFHIFSTFYGKQSKYCEGILDGIATVSGDRLDVDKGSSQNRKKVTKYDTSYFGQASDLRSQITENSPQKIMVFMNQLDTYFSDKRNQTSSNSVS